MATPPPDPTGLTVDSPAVARRAAELLAAAGFDVNEPDPQLGIGEALARLARLAEICKEAEQKDDP